jgi:2-polyprenyl-3-methyl-5-hydroxy-6-metoxy-1,4-benzoquinol methylase
VNTVCRSMRFNTSSDELATPVTLESTSCPLCGSDNDEVVLTGHDRLHGVPGEFNVVKCRSCQLMRTNPRPTAATMGVYYPADYGPYVGTQVGVQHPSSKLAKVVKKALRRLFNDNSQKLPSLPPTTMLEIGCASGAFLHQMASMGWQVEGIEFSEEPARAARALGYRVQSGALEDASAPQHPVDLVVGWMVLEHLHDPVACLWKLRQWSNPGARLVVSVPNAGSLEFRIFRDAWYALQVPTHVYHFTVRTLTKVLEAGGWSVESTHHHRSIANLLLSTAYVLKDKGWGKLSRWIEEVTWSRSLYVLTFPVALFLAMLGQTGRMTVWASRSVNADVQEKGS